MHLSTLQFDADQPSAPAVGGWLVILAATILVWQPLNVALAASHALAALSTRGLPMVLVLIARALIASLGIGAGLAILERRRGAVSLTAVALLLGFAGDVFLLSTSYLPNNLPPGDAPLYMVASLTYHGAWLAYLLRSKRVRSTLIF